MPKKTLQDKWFKHFPNINLSNLYFDIWHDNIVTVSDFDDEKYMDILSMISSEFMFILPVTLALWEKPYKNDIEAINSLWLVYWWMIKLDNYIYNKPEYDEMVYNKIDVQWFYYDVKIENSQNFKKYLKYCIDYSRILHSPMLVNFEDKVIIWFFEWWLKILIYNEEKRLEVKEKFAQYIRS